MCLLFSHIYPISKTLTIIIMPRIIRFYLYQTTGDYADSPSPSVETAGLEEAQSALNSWSPSLRFATARAPCSSKLCSS